ncbi:MAG: NAD(P)H-dependent glycerol-3-phosphate dehydrogenase [Clostridia bacterium]|nr:NAD(P)H-dependent glycerol-3-phosphate dehydrogenase [Clostridia bacterium]
MKIPVIGCGRWGSFIAWYLDSIGHEVTLYGRRGSKHMAAFEETRTNGLVTLKDSIHLGYDIAEAAKADTVVVSVGAQSFRNVAAELAMAGFKGDLVLCMKGIETGSGKRLSEIAKEYLHDSDVAVWIGPGHVQEFTAGIPNCMVIDGTSDRVREKMVEAFSSPLIRFYYGYDLIGNEVGAAAKNVIGIAAGVLDGLGLTNLKGALMARGTREVARLIAAMGGNEQSAYGLCHLGDYQATVFSKFSHNRAYGEALVSGTPYDELAEGCYTVEALMMLKEKYGVDMPISTAVHNAIYGGACAREEINGLFMRSLKKEF